MGEQQDVTSYFCILCRHRVHVPTLRRLCGPPSAPAETLRPPHPGTPGERQSSIHGNRAAFGTSRVRDGEGARAFRRGVRAVLEDGKWFPGLTWRVGQATSAWGSVSRLVLRRERGPRDKLLRYVDVVDVVGVVDRVPESVLRAWPGASKGGGLQVCRGVPGVNGEGGLSFSTGPVGAIYWGVVDSTCDGLEPSVPKGRVWCAGSVVCRADGSSHLNGKLAACLCM
jgi:hypothetical protein